MPTTHVPAPEFTERGFVAPDTPSILTGRQQDINQAFGGNLNPSLTTPQGQIATSDSAIIADCYAKFCELANNVDPAFASGRMQDAIGRIYFLSRIPARATVVTATCSGADGTTITAGSSARDQNGNIYVCTSNGTIGISGQIDLVFQAAVTGPIECPPGSLNTIVSSIPGWDAITNADAGTVGYDVESRQAFAERMRESVAINAVGTLPAVIGEVLNVNGVIDAFATQNTGSTNSGAIVTGEIDGTELNVTDVTSGTIQVGMMIAGDNVIPGTWITALISGDGGTGTYAINYAQTVSPETMQIAMNGVVLKPHSIFVSVYGGTPGDVATAIWKKVSSGADTNGNTPVTIYDTESGYVPPYPSYIINFETPDPTPILFDIVMQGNTSIPPNATFLIKQAVMNAFNGLDGGARARIGSMIYASRFYGPISLLGSWAVIYNIQLGFISADYNAVLMSASQVPTVSENDINVTFI